MRLILPTIVSLALLTPAFAQEWTRFRGPNGSGIAAPASIPVKWTGADYNWRITLPGGGHSSPVIWGDRIFVTCGDKETGRRSILCINAADGSTRWKRDYASQTFKMHLDNSYASSTPAVDEGCVYFCWTSPQSSSLIALDHDGKDVWSVDLGPVICQHGAGASPIVFQDLVILPNDQEQRPSFIIAVDRKTGEVKWKLPRKSGNASTATPCIYSPPGQSPQIIVSSRDEGIAGIDPASGRRLWQVVEGFDKRVVASPVIAGDLVIGNCGEGGVGRILLAIRPGDSATPAKVAYRLTASTNPPAPYVPTPVVKGELMFLLNDNGVISCVRADTGQLVWKGNLGTPFYGSPVCVGDRLYMISRRGEVFVVSADEKFELLARNPLGEPSFATPAVANGRMYLRTLTHLISIGGKQ